MRYRAFHATKSRNATPKALPQRASPSDHQTNPKSNRFDLARPPLEPRLFFF
jgi:hypothetical protein